MQKSRGEEDFINIPGFAAKLYDSLMQSKATRLQYQEIAQDLVSRIDGGRLLDIGTGPGYLLLEIHKLNPRIELFGLDISTAMLRQARVNLTGINVDLRLGNIRSTEYERDSFELVTCSGSFYLWDRPLEGLEEIYRILKIKSAAYLYETHRDIDKERVADKMRENLEQDNLIRRILAPRFFFKQLGMTYNKNEIREILEKTSFVNRYRIEEMTLAGLPVWLRIVLEKEIMHQK
jgi:ubiquinone/menaquinone biosynthesis C-methylase UbiE